MAPFNRYPRVLSTEEARDPDLASRFPIFPSTTYRDLSFGVELEFMLYWRTTPYEAENAPSSLIPAEEDLHSDDFVHLDSPSDSDSDLNEFFLEPMPGRRIVKKLFRKHGIKVAGEEGSGESLFPKVVLMPETDETGWTIGDDPSVHEKQEHPLVNDWMIPGYDSASMEITSPILRDCDEAREHVAFVVRTLTQNLKIRVNTSCGFHVHVGAGTMPTRGRQESDPAVLYRPVPHDFLTFKRAAMLLWAADPFLAALHPPERQWNVWTDMIRQHSYLARGIDELSEPSSSNAVRVAPEQPLETEPEKPPLGTETRLFEERFSILRPDRMDLDAWVRFHQTPYDEKRAGQDGGEEPVVNQTVMDGVAKIHHRTRHRRDAASMMCATNRANYHFTKYHGFHRDEDPVHNYFTVEFREAAGSVDADWIVTWARICTGIFSFCRETDDAGLQRVIARLASAEQAARDGLPYQYDVVRLLQDLDLFTEAAFVELRKFDGLVSTWYPGRTDFSPGEALYDSLCDLARVPAFVKKERTRDMPSSSVVNLMAAQPEPGDEESGNQDFWFEDMGGLKYTMDVAKLTRIRDALKLHPEFARITAWLTEGLEAGKLSFEDSDSR